MGVNSRLLWMGLGFVALVGLFLFVQRDRAEREGAVRDLADVVHDTSPAIEPFEAEVSEPRLITPATSRSGAPEAGTFTEPGDANAGSGSVLAPAASDATLIPSQEPINSGSMRNSFSSASSAPSAGLPPGPGPMQGGPSAGIDPSMRVTEMISLPPSKLAPEAGGVDYGGPAPEQGSIDSAMAPEAGSAGVLGEAPELLPVTQPGPAGEMPDNSGPLPPQ